MFNSVRRINSTLSHLLPDLRELLDDIFLALKITKFFVKLCE